ncbi:DUF4159 domain-containing protein [Fuerstiella marisgermanici]|uniref:DUF4159 domain-containing protein n=1 Tax=Fuerstiella marisgermanici TaxID=1891926 RepID=A0A1P8WNY7_9PLAN|nr:DUF4159 domain-containing protein [Fuerstiella marisgermanici]APZ95782.1 hypothetical protein Fuma_05444 [Fuerstiella marisgermanici]
MNRSRTAVIAAMLLVLITAAAVAQFGGYRRFGYGRSRVGPDGRPDRRGVPDWKVDEKFKDDVFTFCRIRYNSYGGRRGDRWNTDYPDADLNFSYRLQQLTSLHTHPDGVILDLTDPKLFDYPFIYIIEPGALHFDEAEVTALRSYLLNGGFLMVDDFWGQAQLDNFLFEMKRVFPDRDASEIPLEHPIFHCVYDLKERPQIPAMGRAHPNHVDRDGNLITWEGGPDTREVHYKGLYDDNGRMMAIICHNTDLGDGWEREGYSEWYFKEFSEKKAYPLGINIVFYAMTH